MKHKAIILVISMVLIATIGCSNSQKKKPNAYAVIAGDTTILTDNYIKLCYGIETEVDTTNFMEHAMQLINTCDYRACISLFKTKFSKIDTVRWNSGFYGLIIPDSNIRSFKTSLPIYNPFDYLSFRFNNLLGDLVREEQSLIFSNGVNSSNPDELFKLQYVEGALTGYDSIRTPNEFIARQTIKGAELLHRKYRESRRLEFILANSYLTLGDDSKAIPIYDKLILQNYYALPCLKNIIKYLGNRKRMEEQEKYIAIFNKMFPNECLLLEKYNQSSVDSVTIICKKCITMGTQRDSISASIFLANFLLNKKEYMQLDSFTNIYFKQIKYDGTYDDQRKFEDRSFRDLKMRGLFLMKQYPKIYQYHFSNLIEKEKNQNHFKEYIKGLYSAYFSTDTTAFEGFFKENFSLQLAKAPY